MKKELVIRSVIVIILWIIVNLLIYVEDQTVFFSSEYSKLISYFVAFTCLETIILFVKFARKDRDKK